jgi:hypothetical protein
MNDFKVREFRECKKGQSLQGFFTLELPSGPVLHDMTFHVREDGARWVGMPARSYTKPDGTTARTRIADFLDKPPPSFSSAPGLRSNGFSRTTIWQSL